MMCKALHRYSRKPAANGQIFLKSGRKSQAPAAHIYPNVSLGLAGLFRIFPPPKKHLTGDIWRCNGRSVLSIFCKMPSLEKREAL